MSMWSASRVYRVECLVCSEEQHAKWLQTRVSSKIPSTLKASCRRPSNGACSFARRILDANCRQVGLDFCNHRLPGRPVSGNNRIHGWSVCGQVNNPTLCNESTQRDQRGKQQNNK